MTPVNDNDLEAPSLDEAAAAPERSLQLSWLLVTGYAERIGAIAPDERTICRLARCAAWHAHRPLTIRVRVSSEPQSGPGKSGVGLRRSTPTMPRSTPLWPSARAIFSFTLRCGIGLATEKRQVRHQQ
jgi:hypothetical protein